MEIGILTAFLGGLLSFLSPCVLPLVPPYLAFLGGTTLERVAGEDGPPDARLRLQVFLAACAFVLGLGTVFVALGATASAAGQLLLENKTLLARVAGLVIIVFGLHFLGLLRVPLLNRELRLAGPAGAGGGLGTSYLLGTAFAFGWTPCIGPILGAILSLAATQETIGEGVALLAVYALGLGMPFLAAAAFIGPFLRWARRFRRHLGIVEKAMGGLLVVVGLLMLTGEFERIAWWLLETFPALATIG